jgi:hypothetical protein
MVSLPKRKKKIPSEPKSKVDEVSPSLEEPTKKLAIRGEIKYPWGAVARAIITVGGKSAESDREGKYEIEDLDPGDYSVQVEVPFPGYETSPQNVTVTAGETKVVDFYLDFEKTIVHGLVYGAEGKPIADANLSGVMSGKDVVNAVTDETGHFKFENASPGYQFIRINAPGYMGQTQDFTAKKNEETMLELHLTPGPFKIFGTILDENDKPLRGEVALSSASGAILQKTESNGESGYYEFSVLPGKYNLLAKRSEYRSEGWRGSVSADQKHDFKLEPIMPIGRPMSPDSSPMPEVDHRRPRIRW